MKKNISIIMLIFFGLSIALFYFSCNKPDVAINKNEVSDNRSAPRRGVIVFPRGGSTSKIVDTVDISANGFLVFPTLYALESYRLFLTNNTHDSVQTYLSTHGFASYGTTLYTASYLTQTVTADQAADYLLDTGLVVQIEHVVYRPKASTTCSTVKWNFVLTMMDTSLTTRNLQLLRAGTYNGALMNQFATNPASDSNFTVDSFIATTPRGHHEGTANTCPSGSAARPMFGHGDWVDASCTLLDPEDWIDQDADGTPDPTYYRCRHKKQYVFWIAVGWGDEDCYFAYGCS